MPEAADARLTELVEAFADGTPVDWEAAESTASTEQERVVIRQLSRIGRAALRQRQSAGPATWSHLQLRQKVGEGAFGTVYRAHDPRLARDVALKLLHEPMAANRARASTAIEEGRLLARVRHPNVVTVHGAESLNGQIGIWTEFIEGETLQAIVSESGPLSVEAVTAIGVDLCRALTAVHEAGLLHRDIKAQNVMRESGGRIVLMDFGTGRDLKAVTEQKGDLSGTPLYLAPEFFTGGEASAKSDIYALGVLLFFLVTGRYPVSGRTVKDVRDKHSAGGGASLRGLRPGVPIRFVSAVDRALDRDPARRFASARGFELALVAAQPAVASGVTDAPVATAKARRGRLGFVAALSVSWTSRGIYFNESVATTPAGAREMTPRWRIMRIAPEGGTPRPVFQEINGNDRVSSFDVSADGSRLALSPAPGTPQQFSSSTGQGNRLWMVNLKALEALRKR